MALNKPSPVDLNRLHEAIDRSDKTFLVATIKAVCSQDADMTAKLLVALEDDASQDDTSEDSHEAEHDEAGTSAERGVVIDDDDDTNSRHKDKKAEGVDSGSTAEEAENQIPSTNDSKRKRAPSATESHKLSKKDNQPQVICLNCNSLFDPEDNGEDSCKYHPGESVRGEGDLNPTEDEIEDDDDSRLTWPNAFDWSCCEYTLEDFETCTVGRHRTDGERIDFAFWEELRVRPPVVRQTRWG